jgi:N-acetylglucosamine kinase-like BadF-type ATPase
LGLTAAGMSRAGDEHYRELALQETNGARTIIEMDCLTALIGASAGKDGIVVIAGGGSIGFGVGREGRRARAGGFGHILGDAGSAYAIGRDAVRASLRAEDGLEGPTLLTELLTRHFQVPTPRCIKTLLHLQHIGVQEVAGVSALVGIAARDGDRASQGILGRAGRDLADLAVAVAGRLGELPTNPLVYPVGGVFNNQQFVGRAFRRRLRLRMPVLAVGRPLYPPIIGAVIAGFRACDSPLEAEALSRLAARWQIVLAER